MGKPKKEKLIKKCSAVVKRMAAVVFLRENVNKDVKNRLKELEELMNHISFNRLTCKATEDARKAKETIFSIESIAKRIAESPLQNELGKKRKEDGASEH